MISSHVEKHPIIFVLLVVLIVMGIIHLLWEAVISKMRYKTQGDEQVTKYTLYFSAICALLAWACVFLGQINPMVKP